MRKVLLRNNQAPGDIVMLSAAVRDPHAAHPGDFLADVRKPCPALGLSSRFHGCRMDPKGPDLALPLRGLPRIRGSCPPVRARVRAVVRAWLTALSCHENLPRPVIGALRSGGHDVLSARENMKGRWTVVSRAPPSTAASRSRLSALGRASRRVPRTWAATCSRPSRSSSGRDASRACTTACGTGARARGRGWSSVWRCRGGDWRWTALPPTDGAAAPCSPACAPGRLDCGYGRPCARLARPDSR